MLTAVHCIRCWIFATSRQRRNPHKHRASPRSPQQTVVFHLDGALPAQAGPIQRVTAVPSPWQVSCVKTFPQEHGSDSIADHPDSLTRTVSIPVYNLRRRPRPRPTPPCASSINISFSRGRLVLVDVQRCRSIRKGPLGEIPPRGLSPGPPLAEGSGGARPPPVCRDPERVSGPALPTVVRSPRTSAAVDPDD